MFNSKLGLVVLIAAAAITYLVYSNWPIAEDKEKPIAYQSAGLAGNKTALDNDVSELIAKLEESNEITLRHLDKIANEVTDLSTRLANLEERNGIETKSLNDENFIEKEYIKQNVEANQEFRLEKLNADFLSETIDEQWSANAESGIQAVFLNPENAVYQSAQLQSSECRGITCKLEVSMNQSVDHEVFEETMISDVYEIGFNYLKSHVKVANGLRTVTYFTSSIESPPYGADPRQRLER